VWKWELARTVLTTQILEYKKQHSEFGAHLIGKINRQPAVVDVFETEVSWAVVTLERNKTLMVGVEAMCDMTVELGQD